MGHSNRTHPFPPEHTSGSTPQVPLRFKSSRTVARAGIPQLWERSIGILSGAGARWRAALFLFLVGVASAHGQTFEVSPFIGGTFGGTLKLQREAFPDRGFGKFENSLNFGVAGGIRFDADDCEKCSLVEFRWMRQNTNISLNDSALSVSQFQPSVTLDHFLADFTREFPLKETEERVKPFLTGTLGAVRISTPVDSATRLVLGIGGGVNIFPNRRWGLRLRVDYLPIILNTNVQKVVCVGGCIVILGGGVVNQLTLSVGPIFQF
jgi:hypothetical protein